MILYTVGYNPIDVVNRKFQLVDLINFSIEKGIQTNNIKLDVINNLKQLELTDSDYLLLNTITTRDLIPYCNIKNLVLFDLPYNFNSINVLNAIRDLSNIFGLKDTMNTYVYPLNSIKSMLEYNRINIPQKFFFNFLLLLTDLNHSDTISFQQSILSFNKPIDILRYKNYAIYFGDVIDPNFFEYLNTEKNTFILKFLPYEFITAPVEEIEKYYAEAIFFQNPKYILIELKQILNTPINLGEKSILPNMLILNPGGIYLTKENAEFYAENLGNTILTYILPGVYSGVTLA